MVIFRISHAGVNITNVDTAINMQKDGGKDPRGRINNMWKPVSISVKKLFKIPSIMVTLRYKGNKEVFPITNVAISLIAYLSTTICFPLSSNHYY